jgi:hypothetical protein
MGRMYVNSLLVTLNVRTSLRQNLVDHSSLVPDCATLGVNTHGSMPVFRAATRDWRLESLSLEPERGEESFVPPTKTKADASIATSDDVSSIKFGRVVRIDYISYTSNTD